MKLHRQVSFTAAPRLEPELGSGRTYVCSEEDMVADLFSAWAWMFLRR